MKWLGDQLDALADDVAWAYRGISDALASGNTAMAAKILWVTLKIEWMRGRNALLAVREHFAVCVVKLAAGVLSGARAAWTFLAHWMARGLIWVRFLKAGFRES